MNSHLSNNHIIHATENVKKAVETMKVGDKVVLKTSVTRTDDSDGACEVFYVKSVRIGNKIYE